MNARTELDEAECRAREVAAFRSEFLRYAAKDDLTQPCPVGRMVHYYGSSRRETIAEMIGYDMDCGDNLTEAVRLLCAASKGEDIQAEACNLLVKLADRWAENRSEM
jgi:hypothetical protein